MYHGHGYTLEGIQHLPFDRFQWHVAKLQEQKKLEKEAHDTAMARASKAKGSRGR